MRKTRTKHRADIEKRTKRLDYRMKRKRIETSKSKHYRKETSRIIRDN